MAIFIYFLARLIDIGKTGNIKMVVDGVGVLACINKYLLFL